MASGLELAAQFPGEGDILASVVANPADDTAKLVYADWLDEHNDPRGPYLRQFVHAVQGSGDLPKDVGFPSCWLELVGVHLFYYMLELDLTEHRTAILARAKPAVAITTEPSAEDDIPVGGSKFGGLPALPRGTEWPRCARAPLEFLAQLDLAETSRTAAGRALPAAGLLSFFMYRNIPRDEYGGPEGRGLRGGLRIIHTPPGTDLHLLTPPDDLTEDFGVPGRPCRLLLADALDVPNRDASWPPFEGRLCSPLLHDADHQLLGYSHITVLAEDPTPGADWEQLIGFSSDNKLNWGWGDGHRLFWYIRSADLRGRRFDETVAIDG